MKWKKLPRLPKYKISECGYVIGPMGHVLKPWIDHNGYMKVQLSTRQAFVHGLVLEAFIGPRPFKHQCAHLDGNRINNHYSNLAWKTCKENNGDKKIHGTIRNGQDIWTNKLSPEDVLHIRKVGVKGFGGNVLALSRQFGVSKTSILYILKRQSWRHL